MQQYFIKGSLQIAISLFTGAAFAQNEKSDKKNKEVQTIVITRTGDVDEKTVIEIKGDKVLINGKENTKTDEVTVNVSRIKDGQHLNITGPGARSWNFNFDKERMSLFSEDSNRAMLGIVTDADDKGAEITSVSKESAAEKAGLKKGDIITKIGDKKIEDAEDVTSAVRAHKPGEKVAITILRDGKEQKLTAELGRWKGVKLSGIPMPRVLPPGQWDNDFRMELPQGQGLYFNTNRPRLGLSIQDTEDGKGVKVIDVDDDGNAAKAGVKEGDIITRVDDKVVNSADEITKMIRENKERSSVKLQVIRNGKTQNIDVKLPRKLKTSSL